MRSAIKGVLLTGAMLLSAASQAYVISVTNASFEDEPTTWGNTDATYGQWSNSFLPGWSFSSTGGPEGTWQPGSLMFSSIPDGNQVAYVNSSGGVGSAIWQTTSEIIQAGYTYTLAVMVGTRNTAYGAPYDGAKISLLGGTSVLASTQLATPPSAGGWSLLTLDFTAALADAGKTLQIRLEGMGTGSQTNFDNVSLTAVPLPAAAWLFGSALLGLGLAKRRAARGDVPA
ncbi:MAG: hypothetical protein CALGDGBN_02343 [Pseudomonadales bacterium]|nr:hypothetical protein [Pseudomonadales bacterium]